MRSHGRRINPAKMCAPCLKSVIQQGELGYIDEFGFACAYICSAHSGYLVGQNILIDGGAGNANP